jgi:hypothetical protein
MSDQAPEEDIDPEIDPGEPVPQLAKFEYETSPGLMSRIRRAIHRRSAVAQLTSFSASIPLVVLKEFWLILIELLGPKAARKDVTHGEKNP